MLSMGGRKVDFDWLLDLAGGVDWSRLQDLIINPEKILSSIELLSKIFPISELVAPNAIKMIENPTVNKIIGVILTFFSSSNSFKDLPDT